MTHLEAATLDTSLARAGARVLLDSAVAASRQHSWEGLRVEVLKSERVKVTLVCMQQVRAGADHKSRLHIPEQKEQQHPPVCEASHARLPLWLR